MKKQLLLLLVACSPFFDLFAQSSDSSKVEIGVQTFDFPSYLNSTPYGSFYGGDKDGIRRWSVGLDARYRISSNMMFRICLGYGVEGMSTEDTSITINQPIVTLRNSTLETKHRIIQTIAGLVYEQRFGWLGITGGPELAYYRSLVFTSKNKITEESTGGFVGTSTNSTELITETPAQNHFGIGFFVGLNFTLCRNLVLSGELHQLYIYSKLKGRYIRRTNESHSAGGSIPVVTTTESYRDLNMTRTVFQYAMPSLAIRYSW